MNFFEYDLLRYRKQIYLIILLLLCISSLILFIGILKENNWSKNFALISMFYQNNKNSSSMTIRRIKDEQVIERICILNVDTRPLERFTDYNDMRKMQHYSVAAYHNLYYANSHGYDYLRIRSPVIPYHSSSWSKVVQLYDVIHRYDIVVLLDGDAYFSNQNISVEFLLSRYNFTINSSLLMSSDPNVPKNKDSKGRITLNTGFLIARNNNLTKYILKKLALCTTTIAACNRWKNTWSYEQRAFSEYIRDQMKVGSELIIAPCDEINGSNGSGTECSGRFITHVWTQKDTLIERLQTLMLNTLMIKLEKAMWRNNHTLLASTSDIGKLAIDNNSTN